MANKMKSTTTVYEGELVCTEAKQGQYIEWTEIKFREPTEEEREDLDIYEDDDAIIFDCKLPEDDQMVLLTIRMKNGDLCVATDTFCVDEYGPYFEGRFEDWDEWDSAEIIAWAPMPEPFKP